MFSELRALARVASVRRQYRETPFFVDEYYAKQLRGAKRWAPIVHFHDVGWRQNLNPSPFFDVGFYLSANEDVQRAGVNPLLHYIEYGWKEGRSPHPAFDPRAFLWAHPEMNAERDDPAAECIRLYGTLSWRKAGGGRRSRLPNLRKPDVPPRPEASRIPVEERSGFAFERFKQQLFGLVFAGPLPPESSRGEASASAVVSRLSLDGVMGNGFRGWAWSPSGAEGERVELWSGEVRVGYCLRHVARPDVDRHVGEGDGSKGFVLPGGSVLALCRLLGGEGGGLGVTVRFGGQVQSVLTASPLVRDLSSYRTLRGAGSGEGWKVWDLWWANSRLLKVRLSGLSGEGQATSLRVLQPVPRGDGRLELAVADELQLGREETVATVGVLNPLLPILFVGREAGGELVFTDLLPFPSLVRGGLHEAEAAAVGEHGGTLEDLCRLSDAYVAEAVGWGEEGSSSAVGEIEVDLRWATGSEAIFDPAVGTWLSEVFKIGLVGGHEEARVSRDLGDRSFVEHARGQLSRKAVVGARIGRGRLRLPSRGIPTVGAVVSRRLSAGPGPGPYIVQDEAFPHRRYLVGLPEGVPASLYGGPLSEGPRLEALPGEASGASGDDQQPVAIVFQDLEAKEEALRVFPVPKDQAEIVPGGSSGKVSVVVPLLEGRTDIDLLLETVSGQVTGEESELILAVANSPSGGLSQLRSGLEQVLPGRGRVVEVAEALNRSEALNRAASQASGEVLLFLEASVILHDPRTVETLGRLAGREGVGTVGCMQLRSRRGADGVARFGSAGYFPSRVDFAMAPHLGVSELDCSEVLGRSVYPVVANGPHCLAVSASGWREVGGLSGRLPNSLAEIDLAVRLAQRGRVSLCTTLVSVFSDAPDGPRPFTDLLAPANLSLWRILPAIKYSTTFRAF